MSRVCPAPRARRLGAVEKSSQYCREQTPDRLQVHSNVPEPGSAVAAVLTGLFLSRVQEEFVG